MCYIFIGAIWTELVACVVTVLKVVNYKSNLTLFAKALWELKGEEMNDLIKT